MEAVVFIGIQASGKTSFYLKNFINSHVRISIDLLNTRNKEDIFLNTCLQTQSRFVVDNTNPTVKEREKYINLAKANKYKVIGYYFSSSINDAINRNNLRIGKHKIPEIGIRSCYKKLEIPNFDEGFDKLFFVRIEDNSFKVEAWKDEI